MFCHGLGEAQAQTLSKRVKRMEKKKEKEVRKATRTADSRVCAVMLVVRGSDVGSKNMMEGGASL